MLVVSGVTSVPGPRVDDLLVEVDCSVLDDDVSVGLKHVISLQFFDVTKLLLKICNSTFVMNRRYTICTLFILIINLHQYVYTPF